jgi:hypothetical protein
MTMGIRQQREGDRMTDYKTRLHESITELQQATKRGVLSRERRFEYIEAITEEYFRLTGEMPDAVALERMADLCLWEELTDPDEHKVSRNEYPFLSETQIARRQEGKHSRKTDNPKIEVPLGIAENYGVDGKTHDYPTRRQRSERENRFVDKEAKARNKARREKYTEFTKVQTVIIHKNDGFARL